MIKFYERSVYGNLLIYPHTEYKEGWVKLTGKQTATPRMLDGLKALGIECDIDRLPGA